MTFKDRNETRIFSLLIASLMGEPDWNTKKLLKMGYFNVNNH